jgi:hypothetical protein
VFLSQESAFLFLHFPRCVMLRACVLVVAAGAVLAASAPNVVQAQDDEGRRFRPLVRRYFEEKQQETPTAPAAVTPDLAKAIGLPEGMGSVVALEHTILQRTPDGETAVDAASHRFRIGDEIRVRIEPLSDVYIYIFNRGPSGTLTALVPTDEETPPFVKGGASMVLPDDGYLEFVPPAGSEELLVIATEQPVQNLQALAGSLMHKAAEELTAEEKAEADRVHAAALSVLDDIFEMQTAGVRHRGLLTPEAQAKVAAASQKRATDRGARSRQVTIEEPPHENEGSTMAIAAMPEGAGKARLLVTISLKSQQQ